MGQKIRRIVTGHDASGKSNILINDLAPNATEIKGWPGLWVTELWTSNEMPVNNNGTEDQGARPMRHDPTPSGTIFRVVEFPPESKTQGIDAKAAFEHLGSHTKPRDEDSAKHPSMHKTRSIDYLVVIAGEMWMVMEDGEVLLRAGDCIVQRGTNHAWVNKSDRPCLLAAILIDAQPAP
jgi:mannose-6-phosphate isomerase-like protein (cupin superfamily)